MEDLMHDAQMFEASVKLQEVQEALLKFAETGKVSSQDREIFKWTALFVNHLALNSDAGISAGLAEQAVTVRPSFYAALANSCDALKRAGINEYGQVRAFLSNLYSFLKEGGGSALSKSEVELAASLFKDLSQQLFVQLTKYGFRAEFSFGSSPSSAT